MKRHVLTALALASCLALLGQGCIFPTSRQTSETPKPQEEKMMKDDGAMEEADDLDDLEQEVSSTELEPMEEDIEEVEEGVDKLY